MEMNKNKEDVELVDWVPEDGYDDEDDESSNKEDELEGINQTETGC